MYSCFQVLFQRACSFTGVCLLCTFGGSPVEAQTADSAMARIKAHGEIVIGYRQSSIPFSYLDANQKPVGYTIDLCMAVVDALKQQISRPELKVRFVPVDLSTIIPLLQNGSIDMECGSTVHTLKRSAQVDFSFVTAASSDHLLVKADSKVNEIEDLAGKSLAVPAGSTNAALAQSINAQKTLNIRFIFVKDQAEGFLTMSTGRADAYMSDNVILSGLKQRSSNPSGFRITGRSLSYLPYGIVVAPNNSALSNAVNSTLAESFRSGKANRLYEKWFSQIGIPVDPTAQEIFRVNSIPG
jgi:glutamate/aspartate transport system substrate-binding protein